jgi:hypothetical protein
MSPQDGGEKQIFEKKSCPTSSFQTFFRDMSNSIVLHNHPLRKQGQNWPAKTKLENNFTNFYFEIFEIIYIQKA